MAPDEHVTEITGPVEPIPPDALPLQELPPERLPNHLAEVPPWLQRIGITRFPRADGWLQPTFDRGMMRNHWPFTTVAIGIFTGMLMLNIGAYAVPIGLAVLIISFLIGERRTG